MFDEIQRIGAIPEGQWYGFEDMMQGPVIGNDDHHMFAFAHHRMEDRVQNGEGLLQRCGCVRIVHVQQIRDIEIASCIANIVLPVKDPGRILIIDETSEPVVEPPQDVYIPQRCLRIQEVGEV